MRNYLVLPDGSLIDFMYPSNREVEIGECLLITTQANQENKIVEIIDIKTEQNNIYFYTAFKE